MYLYLLGILSAMYEMICEKVDNMMCRTRKRDNWKALIVMNVRIKMTSAALELRGGGVHLESLAYWRGAERAGVTQVPHHVGPSSGSTCRRRPVGLEDQSLFFTESPAIFTLYDTMNKWLCV